MLFWLFLTLSPNGRNRQAGKPCQITSRHCLLGLVQFKSNSGTDPYVMVLSVCIATKLCFVDVFFFKCEKEQNLLCNDTKALLVLKNMFSGAFLLMYNE